ncbi:glycerol-3-phosphate dehydrogenase [Pseudahrensia aquimaris]|uniref:Glycerol-3-phosphate dehydrogenase n=1 Tax=Pseudahrensia aquimaris TaxID=744461 RepID=A0ABW3FCA2_9HYPH
MVQDIDVFIIGGGINGVGIARDAAGRGYTTVLCEMNDLASGTSNWSSKLVHGGVRYLEHYEFMLVRKALKEREVLWSLAPHIIRPMRFIMPHHKDLRPAWLLRLGLFLYDNIGGRKLLPGTRTVDLANGVYGKPLKAMFTKGFQYSDCQVDDARLVVLNAMDAKEHGAQILVRNECVSARREGDKWHVTTRNALTGGTQDFSARLVVNAAGPWIDSVLGKTFGRNDAHNVRMVQGSHIVVPKLFEHDNAYIFQNADGRIIFAIPFTHDTTLIGTTDRDYEGDPADVAITPDEIDYLCAAASEYFEQEVTKESIVWTYSGVRPLYDDGASAAQEATRDYIFKQDGGKGDPDVIGAPLINIFGGKITTYRELAERMMDEIETELGRRKGKWTGTKPLPGGDFPTESFNALVEKTLQRYPFLDPKDADRMCHAYGTRIAMVLGQASSADQLGEEFGAGLSEAEVRYLMTNEWAMTADDIVWRRSKLGMLMSDKQIAALDKWMKAEAA